MTRGLFILVLQVFVCIGVTALGLWAVTRPKSLQRFINSNYALLPAAKDGWQVTPIFLWFCGVFLLWYGYTLAGEFHGELWFLGRVFRINS